MARLPHAYCFGAATGSSKPPRRSTGERPPNEDRWTAHTMNDAGLYGVFDGHGGDDGCDSRNEVYTGRIDDRKKARDEDCRPCGG